jgi:hypothetical protein
MTRIYRCLFLYLYCVTLSMTITSGQTGEIMTGIYAISSRVISPSLANTRATLSVVSGGPILRLCVANAGRIIRVIFVLGLFSIGTMTDLYMATSCRKLFPSATAASCSRVAASNFCTRKWSGERSLTQEAKEVACFVSANSLRILSTYIIRCAGFVWPRISALNLLRCSASSSANTFRAISVPTSSWRL